MIETTGPRVSVACTCGWSASVAVPEDCDPNDPMDLRDVEIGALMRHAATTGASRMRHHLA
jgi:hypothetical protein